MFSDDIGIQHQVVREYVDNCSQELQSNGQ